MFHSRRDVLKTLGITVAAVAALGATNARLHGGERSGVLSFKAGTTFATCTLLRVEPQERGAVRMLLAGADGRTFTVEVMRFDPRVPGVARAGSLAVYVSNGGGGAIATDEEHGLGAMALAAEIAKREAAGMHVPQLATMSDRGEPGRAREATA